METLISILIIPLMLLNLLGGISSGIWLAILGQWKVIGLGVFSVIVSPTLLGLLMTPGILLVIPAVKLIEKGRTLFAFPLIFLNQLYVCAIIMGWCLSVFYIFMAQSTPQSLWPLLIWSYGVALGPWQYMSEREQSESSTIITFFAQIAYIAMALITMFFRTSFMESTIIFGGILSIGTCFQAALAFAAMKNKNETQSSET